MVFSQVEPDGYHFEPPINNQLDLELFSQVEPAPLKNQMCHKIFVLRSSRWVPQTPVFQSSRFWQLTPPRNLLADHGQPEPARQRQRAHLMYDPFVGGPVDSGDSEGGGQLPKT